jgi:hypothetical protein
VSIPDVPCLVSVGKYKKGNHNIKNLKFEKEKKKKSPS